MMAAADEVSGGGDFTSSIGLRVKHDGSVIDSIPSMPAFESGLSPYLKIIAVSGRAFSVDAMKRAIRDSMTNSPPIEVVTENTTRVEAHRIQYYGGSQFPHLERVKDAPDYLGEILKALTPAMN